jgi:translation initiation factor eIF-2B subunit delta
VFRDYQAPSDQAISRHLEAHLRPLIAFLVQARPLAISMGHAIRHLKLKISTLPPDTTDSEARDFMIAVVDNYLRNRIELSDQLIAQHGCTKILPRGDVILTFAYSGVVAETLIRAYCEDSKRFRVIVVDSRPFLEGRRMLDRLVAAGIPCSYLHLNSLGHVMKEVTKVFLGAHGLFSNGALLARVGTATTALLARNANKPVIVCCETLKFSDHLQMDSIVFNEVANPDTLISSALANSSSNAQQTHSKAIQNWSSLQNLKLLNILFDVTPPEFISLVISEIGLIPVTSIPVVLREYNSSSNNVNSSN